MTAIATVAAVGYAGRQIHHSKELAVTSFEDDFDREYRELQRAIGATAFFVDLSDDEAARLVDESLDEFYSYFDLSNMQAFLRERGRVRDDTWDQWRSGIHSNFALPAFAEAWRQVESRNGGSFDELRHVLAGSS